ncbi:hypothetical protein V9T40_005034 [Parthenolecanium corni]|uniref:Uncharacterized protein n=1 Tax=Parthenolecanium corni TaxID=536013 RepID=A0AAN9Y2A3_9HEMI
MDSRPIPDDSAATSDRNIHVPSAHTNRERKLNNRELSEVQIKNQKDDSPMLRQLLSQNFIGSYVAKAKYLKAGAPCR